MTADDNLRYWYEHELTRLRAAERAGFNVTKEKEEVTRLLNIIAEEDARHTWTLSQIEADERQATDHGCCGKCNRHHTDQCDECKAYITGAVKLTNGDREIEVALPTDWTTP